MISILNIDKIIKEEKDDSILENNVIYIRDISHKYKDVKYIKIIILLYMMEILKKVALMAMEQDTIMKEIIR